MDCEICANASYVHPCPCVHTLTWTHTERLIDSPRSRALLYCQNVRDMYVRKN